MSISQMFVFGGLLSLLHSCLKKCRNKGFVLLFCWCVCSTVLVFVTVLSLVVGLVCALFDPFVRGCRLFKPWFCRW